jgi:hypothetical protein
VAVRDDPSRLACFHALREGLIGSDWLDVELRLVPMGVLVRGYHDELFDLVESSTLAVADSAAHGTAMTIASAGLGDRRSVMLFVVAGSPLTSPAGLRGRTIAQQPGGASSTLMLQFVLQERYGLVTRPGHSDVRWVSVPQEQMSAALISGQVDAAMQNSLIGWQALRTPELRLLCEATTDFAALTGGWPLNTGLLTSPEVGRRRAAAIAEMNRLLSASVAYTDAHRTEVFAHVARETDTTADYLNWWWETFDISWGPVQRRHLKGIQILWEAAVRTGYLRAAPPHAEDFLLYPPTDDDTARS